MGEKFLYICSITILVVFHTIYIYVFTKMMHPLARLWRSKGLKAIVYLDEGTVASQNESSANAASAWVRDTL